VPKQRSQKLYQIILCVVKFGLLNYSALCLLAALTIVPTLSYVHAAESIQVGENLETQWRRAIDTDNIDTLRDLLPAVDIQATNEKGKNALMAAAKSVDMELYDKLLERGISVETRSKTGGTLLMYAVHGNDKTMIQTVLAATDHIDAQSSNGWTALMIAAAKGFENGVRLLVDAGANPNMPDVYQWSPLMRAIDNNHFGVAGYLLTQPEIEVNVVNENGATALHLAVQNAEAVIVKQLLRVGASTSVKDKNGATAKMLAKKLGNQEIADLLN